MYVSASDCKGGGAHGKIEAPTAAEACVVAEVRDGRLGSIEAPQPLPERARIVGSKRIRIADHQPGPLGFTSDAGDGREHAAWKDVLANEVGAGAIRSEHRI